MAWQRVRIDLPDDLTPAQRKEAGRLIVEGIIERSQQGMGVRKAGDSFRHKPFAEYSEAYLDRKKKAGKYSGNVDLTLDGDMLAALDVISDKKGSVLIGFENGSEENSKAEGNITGSYGGAPNPRKARNFLGLTRSEVRAVVKAVKSET